MKKECPSERGARFVVGLSGGFSAVLGLSVLAGWHTQTLLLIQVLSPSVPMAYSAALGFFLCGAGLLSVTGGWIVLARLAGGGSLTVGFIDLGSYCFGVEPALGRILLGEAIRPDAFFFGHMAPTAAVGFMLSGTALLLVPRTDWGEPASAQRRIGVGRVRAEVIGLAGIFVTMVGVATSCLYVTGTITASGWGQAIRVMAVHTAVGFTVLGMGIFAVAWRESRAVPTGRTHWLPALVGASAATATLMLWQAMLVGEHEHIEREIASAAANVKNEVTARMDARILALVRLARRWEYAGPPPQQQWEFEAGLILPHFPGYQAIVWVDAASQARWIVSLDAPQAFHNLRVVFEEWGRRALEMAREQQTTTVTDTIDLAPEGKGFAVFVPLFYGQDFHGFMVSVLDFQALFASVLETIAPGYAVALFDGKGEIYRRGADSEAEGEWSQEITVDPYGASWQAQVWPEQELLDQEQSTLPAVVLSGGLALAALLTLMVTDLIARKRAEEALRKAHAELEQRVRERTAELAEVNENLRIENRERKWAEERLARQATDLARSNSELEQFAHVASHDLQEPLRKILAFGDRLKSRYQEVLHDQGCDDLDRMQAATARMQTLIDDLLILSRVTTRPEPFVPVDLSTVAQEVIADMEVRLQQTRGEVCVDQLPTLDADPVQMHQLLQNLISNALKFHRKGEPPVVKVQGNRCADQAHGLLKDPLSPEHCHVQVTDNGIGFDEKYLNRIFDPFQRLHGRGDYEGTGMGLAICRKIVERHSGTLTAHSTPGQGATFTVTLPVRQSAQERTP